METLNLNILVGAATRALSYCTNTNCMSTTPLPYSEEIPRPPSLTSEPSLQPSLHSCLSTFFFPAHSSSIIFTFAASPGSACRVSWRESTYSCTQGHHSPAHSRGQHPPHTAACPEHSCCPPDAHGTDSGHRLGPKCIWPTLLGRRRDDQLGGREEVFAGGVFLCAGKVRIAITVSGENWEANQNPSHGNPTPNSAPETQRANTQTPQALTIQTHHPHHPQHKHHNLPQHPQHTHTLLPSFNT